MVKKFINSINSLASSKTFLFNSIKYSLSLRILYLLLLPGLLSIFSGILLILIGFFKLLEQLRTLIKQIEKLYNLYKF